MSAVPDAVPLPHFRVAAAADVPAVVPLVESAYRGESSRAGWTTEAHLLDGQRTDAAEVTAAVQDADGELVLAEGGDGALLGCCRLERRGDIVYFGTFAVAPGTQGSGVGSALLGEGERRARGWGARAVQLTVIRQREDLLAWYERRGYVRTGQTQPFPYDDERYGRPRVPDLEFLVLEKPLSRG